MFRLHGPAHIAAAMLTATLVVSANAACQRINPFPENYVGIGVELKMESAGATVVKVIEGGPAALAGLAPGAVITAINGQAVSGMTLAGVVDALRGPAGSELVVQAMEKGREFRVTMVRSPLVKAQDGDYRAGAPATRGN